MIDTNTCGMKCFSMLTFQRYIQNLVWVLNKLKMTQIYDAGHIVVALLLLESSVVENNLIDLEVVALRFCTGCVIWSEHLVIKDSLMLPRDLHINGFQFDKYHHYSKVKHCISYLYLEIGFKLLMLLCFTASLQFTCVWCGIRQEV